MTTALFLTLACAPTTVSADSAEGTLDSSTPATTDDSGTTATVTDSGDTEDTDTGTACDPTTWYADADADGYGDASSVTEACEAPDGAVADKSDCDDQDPQVFPGSHATEVPGDGIDQDCDGEDVCRDLNCDGWPDLVFAQTDLEEQYDHESVIYLGGADGYDPDRRWTVPTVGAMGVDSGDLDQDGYPDLVFASVQDGESRLVDSLVAYNGPDGFTGARRTELPTTGCADPTVADVDQDGWLDVVFANRYDGSDVSLAAYQVDSSIYWGGAAGYSAERRLELPTVGAARSRIADLDGDGFMDLVFANGVTDLFFLDRSYVYWGSKSGWTTEERTELQTVYPEGLAIADFNADGQLDVLFTTWLCVVACGEVSPVFLGNGGRDYGNDHRVQLAGIEGAVDAQVADLDGDGHLDLVLANGGLDWTLAFADHSWVWYSNSGAFYEDGLTELPTTAASECGVEDLDGDGHPDIVCASHYAPADGSDEVSQVYWGSATGFDASSVTELPTTHAAGLTIVGSAFGPGT